MKIERRAFLATLSGSLIALPRPARAQWRAAAIPRVGPIAPITPASATRAATRRGWSPDAAVALAASRAGDRV